MAYQYRMLFVLLVVFLSNISSNQDPCESRKYLVDDGGRGSSCDLQYDTCDRYIKERWYHVITVYGDLTIPTSCVEITKCGTSYPIWMDGTLPAVEDGIVNRTACVSTPGNCCHHSYNIMVKNCTYFFTYYLVRSAGCNERYCFGNSSQCPTPSPSTVATSMEPASSSTPSEMSLTSTVALSTTITRDATSTDIMDQDPSHIYPPGDVLCTTSYIFMSFAICSLASTFALAVYLVSRNKRETKVCNEERPRKYVDHEYSTLDL